MDKRSSRFSKTLFFNRFNTDKFLQLYWFEFCDNIIVDLFLEDLFLVFFILNLGYFPIFHWVRLNIFESILIFEVVSLIKVWYFAIEGEEEFAVAEDIQIDCVFDDLVYSLKHSLSNLISSSHVSESHIEKHQGTG